MNLMLKRANFSKKILIPLLVFAGLLVLGAGFFLNSQSQATSSKAVEVVAIPVGFNNFESGFITPASCGVLVGGEAGNTVDFGHAEFGGACSPPPLPPPSPPCDSGSVGRWSSCSASCGGGVQTRTVIHPDCTIVTEIQSCNTQACVTSLPPGTGGGGVSSTVSTTGGGNASSATSTPKIIEVLPR